MKTQRIHCVITGLVVAFRTTLSFVPNTRRGTMRSKHQLNAARPSSLNVGVVGGGPSGLLLTHLLLLDETIKVTVFESREDSRIKDTEQRAYALGIGIRGRSSIRQVDEGLWQAVKRRGFESERFQLHVGGFVIPLRSEEDGGDGVEPSLLAFQSELCAGLTEELERRHIDGGRLKLKFGTKVKACDLEAMEVIVENDHSMLEKNSFDLIVGCDGVNSPVRTAMKEVFPAFEAIKERLPGEFRVVRLDKVPPKVDPASVSLILPRKGSSGAFVEPTGEDGSCCILFSGRGDTPILREKKNITAVVEALEGAFPQWEGFHETIAAQIIAQPATGTASSVVCNIYNFGDKAALAGDAAHATGGVSGQGVNSALVDSVVLAKCIRENREDLAQGLLEYSCLQVPEGKALYDLSFGPKPKGLKGIQWAFRNARDTLFRGRWGIGRPPLQTQLTTDLTSFSDIRRERDMYYDEAFPSDEEFRAELAAIHGKSLTKAEVSKPITAKE
jgi:kynurenine 3-monooxygenase